MKRHRSSGLEAFAPDGCSVMLKLWIQCHNLSRRRARCADRKAYISVSCLDVMQVPFPKPSMMSKLARTVFFVGAIVIAMASPARRDAPTLTIERVYHTIIDESPYLVDRTTTVVWTQTPGTIESETAVSTSTPA